MVLIYLNYLLEYVLGIMNKYYVDTKVEGWVREWFKADSDEEAKELIHTGEYIDIVESTETLYDSIYWEKEYELYNESNELIEKT